MKTTVYKGISDASEVRELPAGKPISFALSEEERGRAVALANGRRVGLDFVPREGDGVMLRILPGASVSAAIMVGVLVVGAIAGAAAGYQLYQQKKALAKMQEDLKDMGEKSNAPVDNRPFLRGATNTVATGKSQPYIMGRHMFTPYLFTHKWYDLSGINGRDQFVTQCLECGFSPLVFEEINADEVSLKTFGTEDGPQEGYGELDDSPLSREGTYEIAQDGEPFDTLTVCNVRVCSETPQKQIPFQSSMADPSTIDEDVIYTLDPYAMNVSVGVTFPNGHYRIDSGSGDKLSDSCELRPEYSLDGGASWISAQGGGGGGFLFDQFRQVSYTSTWEYKTVTKSYSQINSSGSTISYTPVPKYDGWTLERSRRTSYTVKWLDSGHTCRIEQTWEYRYKREVRHPVYGHAYSNTFSHNTTDEVRCQATHDFTWRDYEELRENGQQNIYLRIRNMGVKDSNRINTAYTLFVESKCFDPDLSGPEEGFVECPVVNERERRYASMLAIRLKSNEANADNLGKINVVASSLARTWDRGLREWSAGKSATSNPAAILLELLTTDSHPLSKMDDSEIDMDAFGSLYEFCEDECFEFNAVQTSKTTKESLLETVCAVCRATIYYNLAGLVSVAADRPQENWVASLDGDSLVEVTVKKEMSFPVDAVRITYTDRDTWTEKTHITCFGGVPFSSLGADAVIQELSVTGVEELCHVEKYAYYMLALSRLRLRTVNVSVGKEGACFTPWTRIRLLDDALGETPQDLIITKSTLSGDTWVLECAEYNPAIYEYGQFTAYEPTISQPGLESDGIPSPFARKGELDDAISGIAAGTAATGVPDTPTIMECRAHRDGVSISAYMGEGGLRNLVGCVNWQTFLWTPGEEGGPGEWAWDDLPDTQGLSAEYAFDRSTDGYPEADDLNGPGSVRYFRCRAVNSSGTQGEWTPPKATGTQGYGTWLLSAPLITPRVSSRNVTLKLSQPPASAGREAYGNVRYRVEVMRPDVDSRWYRPATSLNPYAGEYNYREGDGYATSDATYIQTMPLKGQDADQIENTPYMFRVTAENEACLSASSVATVTCECDSIRDIVKAKETAKEAYITELSSISANLGTISSGSLDGSASNFWELSSFADDAGRNHHEGAFRVGGTDEYMHVIPVDEYGNDITEATPASVEPASYRIEFKVGNFSVSSTATQMSGEFVLMLPGNDRERVRLTPGGMYFETLAGGVWTDNVHLSRAGTVSASLQTNPGTAEGSLVITNADMAQRRMNGSDIGLPMPSGSAEVWHFDNDFYNQHGVQTLTLEASGLPGSVYPTLVDGDTAVPQGSGIDTLRPALLAEAPYATEARACYGNYSIFKEMPASDEWQVEWWMKNVWNESQTIFTLGNAQNLVSLYIRNREPYYNEPSGGEPPYNSETGQAVLIPYNEIHDADVELEFESAGGRQTVHGVAFEPNRWYHAGVVCSGGHITVLLEEASSRGAWVFEQGARFVDPVEFRMNPGKQLMCVDELMACADAAGGVAAFHRNSDERIPYGTLDKDRRHFVLDVDGSDVWTNLFDKEEVQSMIFEPGTVHMFAGASVPAGWLLCDGSEVSRERYARLFAEIGTIYGAGDGSTTFNLPDYRECVPVGAGESTRTDIEAHDVYTLGEFKDDQVQNITGKIDNSRGVFGVVAFNGDGTSGAFYGSNKTGKTHDGQSDSSSIMTLDFDASRVARTGTTTHGKQLAVNYIIKY